MCQKRVQNVQNTVFLKSNFNSLNKNIVLTFFVTKIAKKELIEMSELVDSSNTAAVVIDTLKLEEKEDFLDP